MLRLLRRPSTPRTLRAGGAAFLLALAAPALVAQETHGAHHAATTPTTSAPRLLGGLGRHHRQATANAQAQRWFDQGLRLAYAFNHAEALRAFRQAVALDPDCAMCHWGIAYVLGPNINAPMDDGAYAEAHAAAQRARRLTSRAAAADRALIEALAVRYPAAAPAAGRASFDSAYARAMAAAAARHPDDTDVATLHAEARMLLSPWVYWTEGRAPRPGTRELLSSLERALARDADHPGACHFYIHAVEAAFPAKALPCAERLAALMPGAGHIVHMPGHIYLRVGRYNDAIRANRHAVHADETYFNDTGGRTGFYAVAYYPHNMHFLGFAATMAGRSRDAIGAARDAAAQIPAAVAAGAPELQLLVAYPHLTLATFGRWDDVLQERMPDHTLRTATALAWFARGVAAVRTGKPAVAQQALDTLRREAGAEQRYPVAPVLGIATRVLDAELRGARGDRAGAIAQLREAMAMEDALTYMEPPYWHQPVRQLLGAALLEAGQAREATRRYREDLDRFPENVWSLAGLARSLKAEGRAREAAAVEARLQRAMRAADVQLAASRF